MSYQIGFKQKKLSFLNFKKIFGDKQFIKKALKLFFSAIIQNIIITAIAYVDNFFLATYTPQSQGLDAKTATILATQLLYLPTIFTVAVCYACSVYSSQYLGNKNYHKFKETTNYMILGSVILNIPFLIIYLTFPHWSITIYAGSINNFSKDMSMVTSNELTNFKKVNEWASMYLQYAMIGQVFYAFSYPFAIAHRQDARPAIPLLGSIAALCLNCILDPVLMILVAKTPKQAILLAAFSTIASRGFDLLIVLLCVCIFKKRATYVINYWNLTWRLLKNIFKRGWFIAINEIIFSISVILLTLFLYKYHPDIRSSISTALLIAQFTKLIWPGMNTIVAVLVLSYLGKNEINTAKQNSRYTVAWSLIIASILAIILFILSLFINPLLNPPLSNSLLDIKDAKKVAKLATQLEWVLVVEIIILGPYAAMNNCIRGAGVIYGAINDTMVMIIWVMMFALISTFAYNPKIPHLLTFALLESNWLLKMILVSILFTKVNWAKNLIGSNQFEIRKNSFKFRFNYNKK